MLIVLVPNFSCAVCSFVTALNTLLLATLTPTSRLCLPRIVTA